MEWLDIFDVHFLFYMSASLFVLCIFYILASKKQNHALAKVEASLKLHQQANHSLNVIITELKRSNRILAELAGVEVSEQANSSQNGSFTGDFANKLYVGNVDYAATESELASFFAMYGQIDSVNIPVNRYTGRARGFGFVTFASQSDAERAMALNGCEFRGRQIQVNFAKEKDTA